MTGITGDKRKQKSCSIDSRVSCQRREKDHMDSINNIRQLGDFSGQPSCKQQMEVNNITHSLSAMQKTSMGITLVLTPKVSFDSHGSSHPENKLDSKGKITFLQ